uniref:Uncharacterized protein n=1 Tax=Rhizophora mucronata TaxID=61149 RepID=A0A2P2Q586_RHIMU
MSPFFFLPFYLLFLIDCMSNESERAFF